MGSKVPEDLKEARRQRLRQLRDDRFGGSNTELARALGKQPDYISRAILGRKVVGEAFARELETTLSLPARWMDGDAVAAIAQDRVFLDAEVLARCISATARWALVDGARLTQIRRAELICTLYEIFFDRPETDEEQMVTFLRRQARAAIRQPEDPRLA